ncbi:DUF4129 domain-containing protein [Sandaracinobacter neustonicus]|uniref:DUF4129 domain-containing protein n=1 Tax=Sandaracinobacter neustonicus TaxID=1715348 RepID=A0A501XUB3_9SPHN|nr:DUF4129 domain-containing protein [Sandaracinobacter neustonicus]TPE63933.1 DUF4129 domain-containing protein [Sandaracinobacter neustonicus]
MAGTVAEFDERYEKLLAAGDIQTSMEPFVQPEPPAWLKWLARFLGEYGEIVAYVGLALGALLLLWLLVPALRAMVWRLPLFRRKAAADEPDEGWRPDEAGARALLAEADSLAESGRFGEAVHALLLKCLEELERLRPGLLRPALTSREIARAPALPASPRTALSAIVATVERAIFASRPISQADWDVCRDAYGRFVTRQDWR